MNNTLKWLFAIVVLIAIVISLALIFQQVFSSITSFAGITGIWVPLAILTILLLCVVWSVYSKKVATGPLNWPWLKKYFWTVIQLTVILTIVYCCCAKWGTVWNYAKSACSDTISYIFPPKKTPSGNTERGQWIYHWKVEKNPRCPSMTEGSFRAVITVLDEERFYFFHYWDDYGAKKVAHFYGVRTGDRSIHRYSGTWSQEKPGHPSFDHGKRGLDKVGEKEYRGWATDIDGYTYYPDLKR